MSEDKEKIELKLDPKDSEKKSSEKLSIKSNKKKLDIKKFAPILIGVALIVIVAVIAIASMNNKSDETGEVGQEAELTYAEDLEQYQVYEGASQDERNTHNLRLAWAYYREDNYERALELLELIQNPVDNALSSYNELYGLTLSAMGRDDEAQKYNQITLEIREEDLLDSADEAPIAYYSLGILYTNTGQSNKAIESYEKYIAIFENVSGEEVYYEGSEYLEAAQQALEELK